MATYVIGDVQGCFAELELLLDKLNFDAAVDQLWFVGDLVNRGPDSLAVLRFVKALAESAVVVLGNHDLHLLAVFYSAHKQRRKDTLMAVLEAPDVDELMQWLVSRPLFYRDSELNACMSHAGIPHIWSVEQTVQYALELSEFIARQRAQYFLHMYGNIPNPWSASYQGMERARCITNYLTRMRFIDQQGVLDFAAKGGLETAPEGFNPWFELRAADTNQIFFGHWASLMGDVPGAKVYAMDTGCVWGATLTAQCIETGIRTSVQALE